MIFKLILLYLHMELTQTESLLILISFGVCVSAVYIFYRKKYMKEAERKVTFELQNLDAAIETLKKNLLYLDRLTSDIRLKDVSQSLKRNKDKFGLK